jgi:ferric-dicitrate binding protein FerR (iron transport regulator)
MNEEYYINLIHKQLSGSISPEEQEVLEKWRMASLEHQSRFEEELHVWDLSGKASELPEDLDLDIEFSKLEQRIKDDEPSEAKVRKLATKNSNAKITYISIAAGLALLIGLAALRSLGFLGSSDLLEYHRTNELGELALADGTAIHLNEQTTLRYPETFSAKERRVHLDGEAFFKVRSDPNKPFVIETTFGEITVLGTAFNVESRSNGKQSVVFVKEGKVKFRSLEGQYVFLEANDLAILDHQSGALEKSSAASSNSLAWFTRELNYQNSPLSVVLADLEELHQSEIAVDKSNLGNCLFSGGFKDQSLASSLQTLALIYNFELKALADGRYQLTGLRCD